MRGSSRTQQKHSQPSTKRERATSRSSNTSVGSNIESVAMAMVKEAGEKGVLQNELLKKLGMNSRKGQKLISILEERNLVRKSRELYGGKWTYRIIPPVDRLSNITWDDMGCPCFFCGDVRICSLGNVISPSSCLSLSDWLRSSTGQDRATSQDCG